MKGKSVRKCCSILIRSNESKKQNKKKSERKIQRSYEKWDTKVGLGTEHMKDRKMRGFRNGRRKGSEIGRKKV